MKNYSTFINENVEYSKEYFLNNVPKHIDHSDLWYKAIDKATAKGTKSSNYGAVTAIYNNLDKKRIEQRKDWVTTSPVYWRQLLNISNGLSRSEIKYYDSIISQLERIGKVSPKQMEELKRFQRGDLKRHVKESLNENKERTSYKEYNVGDVIDGSKLDDLSGNLVGNDKNKYMLVQKPLSDFSYTRDDLINLDPDYAEEEIWRLESMKDNFEKTPPIPEEGDGMHRIIAAKELGYDTILMWKKI